MERWNEMVEWTTGMEYWNAPPIVALCKMHHYLDSGVGHIQDSGVRLRLKSMHIKHMTNYKYYSTCWFSLTDHALT